MCVRASRLYVLVFVASQDESQIFRLDSVGFVSPSAPERLVCVSGRERLVAVSRVWEKGKNTAKHVEETIFKTDV